MIKAYRYRLYPTKNQCRQLEKTLDLCRWVYNETLARRKQAYEEDKIIVRYEDTAAWLPKWKTGEKPDLKEVHSQVLQETQRRLQKAFENFFGRVKQGTVAGYPRFKSYERYDSFTYPQSGFKLGTKLWLSKIGDIKIKLHRPLDGHIKTLTIKRARTGKWFASFAVEIKPKRLPKCERAIGIDCGLNDFFVTSDGKYEPNPRFFRREERALAKVQRNLSAAEKGTPARDHRRRIVARVHERISNKRSDFIHRSSRKLVNSCGLLVFEDLNIRNMLKNHHLAKSISDVAWGMLIRLTNDKAAEAGRLCLQVDPRGTSQRCSGCGKVVKKVLSERVHDCPYCNLILNRDENAARNILALGLQCVGNQTLKAPSFSCGE